MKQPTIKHTSIKGNPLIEIILSKEKSGTRRFGIHYDNYSRKESCIDHYGIKHNVKFSLERIIKDYITHYGLTKAIEILIGKGIINSSNRAILITD